MMWVPPGSRHCPLAWDLESRRRTFGLSLVLAGAAVMLLAVMPRLAGVAVTGFGAGSAFLCGVTLIGVEVADEVRGRVFAFVQTSARAVLLLAVSAASALAGAVATWHVSIGVHSIPLPSSRVLLLLAGASGVAVGMTALRQMDDRPDVPVLSDLRRALTRRPGPPAPPPHETRTAAASGTSEHRDETTDIPCG
jgi:dTMP kinase